MTRWTPLTDAPEQVRLRDSTARNCVAAAGRRSGKTERAKRRLVQAAMMTTVTGANFIACAPTRDQAKRIWWEDLIDLAMTYPAPGNVRGFWVDKVIYTELTILLQNGARLMVVGLDRPQRIEGIPIDGAVLDEYAECKPEAWTQSLRPALSTIGRPGWVWFIGRPRGRNHFYDLWTQAKTREDWDSFHWPSSDILPPEEIEAAKRDLDPLTYAQEYEAAWVNFEGLAYYQWNPNDHLRRLEYDPNRPLVFCFDFNVDPGVAAVVQEQVLEGEQRTCVIGEVHIPRNSNTPAVCRKLVADWERHQGDVYIYGDASGGARHTAQTEGTDWDLVREVLRPVFGDRIRWRVPRKNPYVRDRINSVNSRLKSTAGDVRVAVDPESCPNVVRDFEGVTLLEGGGGEIDKRGCEAQGLTHLTDAVGYYIHERHPIKERATVIY